MKKRKIPNDALVTYGMLTQALKSHDARFDALSRAIYGLERVMRDGFKQINEAMHEIDSKFNRIDTHIDAFMKRTEDHNREIIFLGRQHDDLAKYCTQKIGYPVYGRNL